jgi:hypothetical protein
MEHYDSFEGIGDKGKTLTAGDAAKGGVALTKSEVMETCEQVA